MEINQIILSELWKFCEKEFNADFEADWINGYGNKAGMSDRTEKFAKMLEKKINKPCKEKSYTEKDMREMYNKSCGLFGLSELPDQTENDDRFKKILKNI